MVPFRVMPGRLMTGHVVVTETVGSVQLSTKAPAPTLTVNGWSTGGVPMLTVMVAGALVTVPFDTVKVKVATAGPTAVFDSVTTPVAALTEAVRFGVPDTVTGAVMAQPDSVSAGALAAAWVSVAFSENSTPAAPSPTLTADDVPTGAETTRLVEAPVGAITVGVACTSGFSWAG